MTVQAVQPKTVQKSEKKHHTAKVAAAGAALTALGAGGGYLLTNLSEDKFIKKAIEQELFDWGMTTNKAYEAQNKILSTLPETARNKFTETVAKIVEQANTLSPDELEKLHKAAVEEALSKLPEDSLKLFKKQENLIKTLEAKGQEFLDYYNLPKIEKVKHSLSKKYSAMFSPTEGKARTKEVEELIQKLTKKAKIANMKIYGAIGLAVGAVMVMISAFRGKSKKANSPKTQA